MELVLEITNAEQFVAKVAYGKAFGQAGGSIGRATACDWVIPDRKQQVSKHHAQVTYRDGTFFLTDVSRNGTLDRRSGAYLQKGEETRIVHGNVYVMGEFVIQALLTRAPVNLDIDVGRPRAAGSTIPDDAFIELDPLRTFDQQPSAYSALDELIAPGCGLEETCQRADYARIDMERLIVPELVSAAVEPTPEVQEQTDGFWRLFGDHVGVDCTGLDHDAREALALNVARLLKQSIEGLQQSLHTRNALKNELRLGLTTPAGPNRNPLKFAVDSAEALGILLQSGKSGQLSAEQSICRAFRELQAHQLALLSASRAAIRGALDHFSPERLTLRFERDNKPFLHTSGSHWRAYGRYHQALRQDDDWSERLLARDFAQAYAQQVRLTSTLYPDHQG